MKALGELQCGRGYVLAITYIMYGSLADCGIGSAVVHAFQVDAAGSPRLSTYTQPLSGRAELTLAYFPSPTFKQAFPTRTNLSVVTI